MTRLLTLSFNFLFYLSYLFSYGFAFSPTSVAKLHRQTVVDATVGMMDGDAEYRSILSKARECALSDDDNTLCDPNEYLWHILELESACAAGNLLGEDDLCRVDHDVAEIVVGLREKAAKNVHAVSPFPPLASPSPTVTVWMTTLSILFCLLFRELHSEATPFSLQEWAWAVKGGYAHEMVQHFFRNGGV